MQNITLESGDKTGRRGKGRGGERERGWGRERGRRAKNYTQQDKHKGGKKAAADRRWRLPNKQTASVTNSSINTALTPPKSLPPNKFGQEAPHTAVRTFLHLNGQCIKSPDGINLSGVACELPSLRSRLHPSMRSQQACRLRLPPVAALPPRTCQHSR